MTQIFRIYYALWLAESLHSQLFIFSWSESEDGVSQGDDKWKRDHELGWERGRNASWGANMPSMPISLIVPPLGCHSSPPTLKNKKETAAKSLLSASASELLDRQNIKLQVWELGVRFMCDKLPAYGLIGAIPHFPTPFVPFLPSFKRAKTFLPQLEWIWGSVNNKNLHILHGSFSLGACFSLCFAWITLHDPFHCKKMFFFSLMRKYSQVSTVYILEKHICYI